MIKSYMNLSLEVSAHDEFEQFVKEDSSILFCDAVAGEWNYLLKAEFEDIADFDDFICEVKERFVTIALESSVVLHNCVKEKIA